uniref:Sema domain-containing protein n=1 Tax=Neogobius melanostomus TaxID=47308 RepID=A0A8C6UB01_9GOBI
MSMFSFSEQYYIKLVVSKQDRKNDALQDKIYGFYNEKNTDTDMYSVMWRPYVTQICMTDTGGPKNNMQSTWTSQLNARLFCGNMEQKQHFSELLDIATVEAGHWQDTRVYGLFQNECTKLGFETLKQIKASREMQKSIQPGNSLGPILISYHHYSHITVHNFQDKRDNNHTILFLSLSDGAVHKVKLKRSGSEANPFIIAEYKPFNHRAHIVSMSLNPSTKKLYVTSKTEVAQIDVANCERYGDVCEECVLAGDPYCGWNEDHCNMANCSISMSNKSPIKGISPVIKQEFYNMKDQIFVPRGSRFFFECPVSSLHAQYGWYHDHRTMTCLLLISSMQPEQEGIYSCESEEQGYRRVLAQYQLRVEDSAEGYTPGLVLWVCLMAALLVQMLWVCVPTPTIFWLSLRPLQPNSH